MSLPVHRRPCILLSGRADILNPSVNRLQIPVLPHIVNAGIATSIYSAGSAFFFNGSRVLHALAVDGYAPKFMRHTNSRGVPWVACLVVLAVGCLSYLQVSAGTSRVLGWFIDVATATQVRSPS